MAIRFECDKCGAVLAANDAKRFIVKMEVFAAAGPIEFTSADLAKDRSGELSALIDHLNHADPDEIEDQTYRNLRFDLCATCHRALLRNPLNR